MSDNKNISVTFYIRAEDFKKFRAGGHANKDDGWVQCFGKPDDGLLKLKASIDYIKTKKEGDMIFVERVFYGD